MFQTPVLISTWPSHSFAFRNILNYMALWCLVSYMYSNFSCKYSIIPLSLLTAFFILLAFDWISLKNDIENRNTLVPVHIFANWTADYFSLILANSLFSAWTFVKGVMFNSADSVNPLPDSTFYTSGSKAALFNFTGSQEQPLFPPTVQLSEAPIHHVLPREKRKSEYVALWIFSIIWIFYCNVVFIHHLFWYNKFMQCAHKSWLAALLIINLIVFLCPLSFDRCCAWFLAVNIDICSTVVMFRDLLLPTNGRGFESHICWWFY